MSGICHSFFQSQNKIKYQIDVIGLSTHLTRQTATMSEGVAEETSCLPGDPLRRPSCKYTNQPTSMAIRNVEHQVSIKQILPFPATQFRSIARMNCGVPLRRLSRAEGKMTLGHSKWDPEVAIHPKLHFFVLLSRVAFTLRQRKIKVSPRIW